MKFNLQTVKNHKKELVGGILIGTIAAVSFRVGYKKGLLKGVLDTDIFQIPEVLMDEVREGGVLTYFIEDGHEHYKVLGKGMRPAILGV